jgi:lysozyme
VTDALAMAATLCRQTEGCVLTAYPDPASGGAPWTIGYGTTRLDGRAVQPGQTITLDEAEAALQDELQGCLATVDRNAPGLTEGQRAALASFVYNLGAGAFQSSTLLRLLHEGDTAGAAEQFGRWIYGGGKVMPGLVKRRALERAVFLGQVAP